MARRPRNRKNGDDDETGEGHNSNGAGDLDQINRTEVIAQTCTRLKGYDEQIKSIQAKRRELVNEKIKGQLGMKVADFSAAYRMYLLDNPEAVTQYMNTIRECFSALNVGEQGWLLPGEAPPDTPTGRRRRSSRAKHAEA